MTDIALLDFETRHVDLFHAIATEDDNVCFEKYCLVLKGVWTQMMNDRLKQNDGISTQTLMMAVL